MSGERANEGRAEDGTAVEVEANSVESGCVVVAARRAAAPTLGVNGVDVRSMSEENSLVWWKACSPSLPLSPLSLSANPTPCVLDWNAPLPRRSRSRRVNLDRSFNELGLVARILKLRTSA